MQQPAKSPAPTNTGGLVNLIELRRPTDYSFQEAAILDLNRALNISQVPPESRAVIMLERGTAKIAFNRNAPSERQYAEAAITQDYNNAATIAPKSVEVQGQAADYFTRLAAGIKPDSSEDWKERKSNFALEAIEGYSRALYLAPNDPQKPQWQQRRAQLLSFVMDKKMEKVPAAEPKTALEWKERGNLYSGAGDWRAAAVAYSKSIAIDPKFADGYNNLAGILNRTRQYDLALTLFNRAVELDPKHRVGYLNRARLWRSLAEADKAIEDAGRAIQFATDPPDKALADVTAAAEIDVPNADIRASVWTLRGDLEMHKLDFAAADTSFAKAVELDAKQSRALLIRALISYLKQTASPDALNSTGMAFLNQTKPNLNGADKSWLVSYCNELLAIAGFKDAIGVPDVKDRCQKFCDYVARN